LATCWKIDPATPPSIEQHQFEFFFLKEKKSLIIDSSHFRAAGLKRSLFSSSLLFELLKVKVNDPLLYSLEAFYPS
jgi:hypothetical protein